MQFMLLLNPDESLFDVATVERAFRSIPEFSDIRLNGPCGSLIECEYDGPDFHVIITLDEERDSIELNNMSDAALRAVLLIQKALGRPLQVIDDDCTFDLTFSDIATVEELEAAMDNAKTD